MARTSTSQKFKWLETGRAKYLLSQAIVAGGTRGIASGRSPEAIEYNKKHLTAGGISPSLQDPVVEQLWMSELGSVNDLREKHGGWMIQFTRDVREQARQYIADHPEYLKPQSFHLYNMEIQPSKLPGFYDNCEGLEKRYLRHIVIVEDNPFNVTKITPCLDVDFMKSLGLSEAVIEGMKNESEDLSRNIINVLGESPIAYHLSKDEMTAMFSAIPDLAETIELTNLPPSPERLEEIVASSKSGLQDYITSVNDEAKQVAVDMGKYIERTRQLARTRTVERGLE